MDAAKSENAPSKVIHWRNVTADICENDLLLLASQFGVVQQVLMIRSSNQALMDMDTVASATQLIRYYTSTQATVRGRHVWAQYSAHQRLQQRDDKKKKEKPNRIILVTVRNVKYPITTDILNRIMSPHGPIDKMVLFEKAAGIQALVQFRTERGAAAALAALQGQNIYRGCCSLELQYSKLTELSVKYNNDMMRDFNDDSLPAGPAGGGADVEDPSGAELSAKPAAGAAAADEGAAPAETLPVLLVGNLDAERVDCDVLFNLFSNYGNIHKIKMMHSKRDAALVEMETQAQADAAIANLRDVRLFGRALAIELSKIAGVKGAAPAPLFKDFTFSPLNRFKNATNVKHITAPTSVLHISNLAPTATETDLNNALESFGAILGLRVFEVGARKQALVQFAEVDDAVNTLCVLHDADVAGRRVRISFSKNVVA